MRLLAELFRIEDWQRTPLLHSAPLIAFLGVSILTTVILLAIQWPADSWRTLASLMAGVAAAGMARWAVVRRMNIRRPVEGKAR